MQALLRVQTRVCDQRRRLSISCEADLSSDSVSDKIPLHVTTQSKDGEWVKNQNVRRKDSDLLGVKQERSWSYERDLAYAYSDKIWNYNMEKTEQNFDSDAVKSRESIQWETPSRYSSDEIKILKVNTTKYKLLSNNCYPQIKSNPNSPIQTPTKTNQPDPKHVQVHSASPRYLRREELLFSKSQTPRLNCYYRDKTTKPSYMAETESAKARACSLTVPKQQKPEREKISIARRRLDYGSSEELASPSCRNASRRQR